MRSTLPLIDPVRPAQSHGEAVVFGHIPQYRVETVFPFAIVVALDYHGLHVVVKHFAGCAAEKFEGANVTSN